METPTKRPILADITNAPKRPSARSVFAGIRGKRARGIAPTPRLRCATLSVKVGKGDFFDTQQLRALCAHLFEETLHILVFPTPAEDGYNRVQVVYWATCDSDERCLIATRVREMAEEVKNDGAWLNFKTRTVFAAEKYFKPIIKNAVCYEVNNSFRNLVDSGERQQLEMLERLFHDEGATTLAPLNLAFEDDDDEQDSDC